MFVATNLGVWKFNGSAWQIDSQLDDSKNTYYIEQTSIGEILAGTEKGLWKRDVNGNWLQIIGFDQLHFSHLIDTTGVMTI